MSASGSRLSGMVGMVGNWSVRIKSKPLLRISTELATPNTDLNPTPFSPMVFFSPPERRKAFVDSPMAVMARTLSLVNPCSLYQICSVWPVRVRLKEGVTPLG